MMVRKVGLLLLFISVSVLSAAEDDYFYKFPEKNNMTKSDITLSELITNLKVSQRLLFDDKKLLKEFPSKEAKLELFKNFEDIKEFVHIQHKNLEPVTKDLIGLWEDFFNILKFLEVVVKKNGETAIAAKAITDIQNIQEKLKPLQSIIKKSGYSKIFKTTRQAKYLVGNVALTLDLVLGETIRALQKLQPGTLSKS